MNLFEDFPSAVRRERYTTLVRGKETRIERIISQGQATPAGKWLRGARREWVVLLTGAAKVRFRKGNRLVRMKTGDTLLIPAGAEHRVEWTHPSRPSVWLAVHFAK